MKRLFLICSLILSALMLNAQQLVTFRGKVVTATGKELLAGASVYIHDIKRGVIADSKGEFSVSDIPAGNHLVEISYSGYVSLIETINITGKDQVFELKPTVAENNEVVVTGVSTATSLKRITVPVTVVKRADLLKEASTNIIDALTRKPGVSQLATGPAISKPVIRGLGYNRVVVINDGVRQEGQQWGDEHGIEVDEFSIQKAEILKGPASIMYGSDAIAGVINFVSNTPVPEGTIKGNVLANYQTNNRQRGFFGNIAGNKNGFSFNAYATYKAAGDYQNQKDGYVFNSKFNEFNFGGHAGINKKWGYSHLVFSSFNQKLGMIEGERNDLGQFLKNAGSPLEAVATESDFHSIHPYAPYQHILHQKLVSDNSFFTRSGKLNINLGVQRNQRMEFGNPEDLSEKELYFDLYTVTYNVQYHFNERKGWKTSVGIAGMFQQNKNKAQEALIPDYRTNDIGAFVFTQKKIGKVNFSGGLRADQRTVNGDEMIIDGEEKFTAFTKSFSNISGSIGFTYDLKDGMLLRFNLARGFRAPNLAELSSNGAHEGTNRYEVGNRNLKSETSFQADAGFEYSTDHLSFTAALFYNRINNFVFTEKVPSANGGDSLIIADGTELYLFRFVQQNASVYGLELSLDIHPHPLDWLHFENSFSYVRGRLQNGVEGNRNIPFMPPARILSEVRFDLFHHKKCAFRNTYFKTELSYNFAQNNAFTTYNTETATPGYTLLNAGLGTDIVSKGHIIMNIYLVASNLTDVSYQNHMSRLKYAGENPVTGQTGVFNMGRNFSIKLNVPLFGHIK